jgi:hypothetical protein
MGVLTDIVLAGTNEAKKVEASDGPSREFPGIDAKGIDQVRMGTLYAILTSTEYDPGFMLDEESVIEPDDEDGPWVHIVPQEMVLLLSELTDADIPAVADQWSKTEEFEPEYGAWSQEDILKFLEQIRGLSKKALTDNKTMYMWMCL